MISSPVEILFYWLATILCYISPAKSQLQLSATCAYLAQNLMLPKTYTTEHSSLTEPDGDTMSLFTPGIKMRPG